MTEDISKKTIIVLVVLTIIVSVLGTLTVWDSVNNANLNGGSHDVQKQATTETSGFVSLKIKEPVEITGNVIINLVKK